MNHQIFRAKQLIAISIILSLTPFFSHSAQKKHMRGTRYCEIILKQSHANYAVYNSWGLNDCPEKIWNKITIDHVKQETGASFARLNGPRYWVIDGLTNSNMVNPTKKTIAGLQMREAGRLHLNMLDLLRASTNYREHTVDRHTTWIYQSGKPIYELIDPKGTVFVMQSYSIQEYPQTYLSLTQLGAKLTLPKGWQFKTGTLKKTEKLQAINDRAVVIQDNFLNTYQMATHDFLVTR
jgi:hypothetical protein